MMRFSTAILLAAIAAPALIIVLVSAPSSLVAAPHVLFSPDGSFVDVGDTFRVHVAVDDSGDSLSCYEISVSFDTSIVELVAAFEGSLYTNSGHSTFFRWYEDVPDTCRILDCVLGNGTYVLGPGSIAELKFEAKAEGIAKLDFAGIDLRDVGRDTISDFSGGVGYVYVGSASQAESGAARVLPRDIAVFPNPFSEGVTISFAGRSAVSDLNVGVYDVSGRLVTNLHKGYAPAGEIALAWDGKDALGRPVPSGVYFAKVVADGERTTGKLFLAR
jgi:hypothetical protein